jgi:ComF family protein
MAILNYWAKITQRLVPGVCLLCAGRADHANLCNTCRGDLPYLSRERCPRCAAPSPDRAVCGACLARPPAFERVVAPCAYAYPLDRLVQSLKYSGRLAVAPLIAEVLLAEIPADAEVDVIVPMPLGPARLRRRGFNQSVEIARLVAKARNLPLNVTACRRVRETAPQSALAWNVRARNVRGAFVCTGDLAGCSVAVVDDVLTTGATLNELARVLQRSVASSVSGWVAARTLAHAR